MEDPQPQGDSSSTRVPVRLPLFPLGAVLCPGSYLPLRIFEPRYVRLLREVLDPATGTREFGVIGIREGHEVGARGVRSLFEVGCTAHVDHLAAQGEASFALLTTGRRRFRLHGLDEAAGTPYLTGLVTWMPEDPGDTDAAPDLVYRVHTAIKRYLDVSGADESDLSDDPAELSYGIPDLVRLELADRVALLAAPSDTDRLALGLRMVRRERALVEKLGALPWVGPIR